MFNTYQSIKDKLSKEPNKRKRNVILHSYNDIKFDIEKENKENIQSNPLKTPGKPLIYPHKFQLSIGQTPIISKTNKVIMVTENKYDEAQHRGKSPFFISDKINFRNEFKYDIVKCERKPRHLGLCDYYSKKNEKSLFDDQSESDFSKTPRFKESQI